MAIIAGAQMIRGYRSDHRNLRRFENAIQTCANDQGCKDGFEPGRRASALNKQIGANAFLDLIGHVIRDYDQALLENQLAAVLDQYRSFESGGFEKFARRFTATVGARRSDPALTDEDLLRGLLAD